MSKFHRLRAAALLGAAAISVSCGGGGGGGGGGPPPLSAGLGMDVLDTSGTMQAAIPADFFGPGSDPFAGQILFEGAPIPTAGPYELGTTDTIIRRRGEIALPPGGSSPLVIELHALTLQSAAPIVVTTNGVNPQPWNLVITFTPVTPNLGLATMTRNGATTGGTFTTTIPVHPVVSFVGPGPRPPQDLGPTNLSTPNPCTWTSVDASPTAPLRVTGLPLGVALTGALSMPTPLGPLNLVVAPAVPAPHPAATVDPTATIEPGVSLGRLATIGAGAIVRTGAVVGPSANVGAGATIGPRAILGNAVVVAPGTTIGADSVLDDGVTLGAGPTTTIGTSVVVGPSVVVGAGCLLSNGVQIGGLATVGAGTTIGADCVIGRQVAVGSTCTLASDLRIDEGATIADTTNQTTSIFRCHLVGGGVEMRGPPSTWAFGSVPAWIAGLVGGDDVPLLGIPLGSPGAASTAHPGLANDVGTDVAPPSNGGTGPFNYDDDDHLCGWFAEALRAKLAAKNYDTTITGRWRRNPDWSPWKLWQDKWIDGHAVTDVHWPDGTVTWIEPQFVGAVGVDEPLSDLDGNGDGTVTYWEGEHVDEPSDGDVRVEVYKSRADAAAHGVNLPGK